MSQENVEFVRSVLAPLDGINGAEIVWDDGAILEMLGAAYSPDIELRTLDIPLGLDLSDSYHGLDGLVEYLRGWLEPFSEYRVQALDYIEDGDRVIVPTRQWGIGRGSGARVELEVTLSYELRDGKITRVIQYDSVEGALEAARLSE